MLCPCSERQGQRCSRQLEHRRHASLARAGEISLHALLRRTFAPSAVLLYLRALFVSLCEFHRQHRPLHPTQHTFCPFLFAFFCTLATTLPASVLPCPSSFTANLYYFFTPPCFTPSFTEAIVFIDIYHATLTAIPSSGQRCPHHPPPHLPRPRTHQRLRVHALQHRDHRNSKGRASAQGSTRQERGLLPSG